MSPFTRISSLFEQVVRSLANGNKLPPLYVCRESMLHQTHDGVVVGGKRYDLDKFQTSRAYTQIIAVAVLVMELIKSNRSMSQRDVYYSLKSLFRTQAESNGIILELGLMLGLKRHEMGIYPASKGLVAGLLRFRFLDSKIIALAEESKEELDDDLNEEIAWTDCVVEEGIRISNKWISSEDSLLDMQIPTGDGTSSLFRPQYLVVVEKEGIFHRLVEDQFFTKHVPCIIMTACGYPDIASRAFVSRVSERYPELILVGLTDYNSYGLAVLLTYRLPTKVMHYEAEGLQAHELHWLGLRHAHIEYLQTTLDASHFQAATERDRGHCAALRRSWKMEELPVEYTEELQMMETCGVKVELESLYALGLQACSDWIKDSLLSKDYI